MPERSASGSVPLEVVRQVVREEMTYAMAIAEARRIAGAVARPAVREEFTYATAIATARRIAGEFAPPMVRDREAHRGP